MKKIDTTIEKPHGKPVGMTDLHTLQIKGGQRTQREGREMAYRTVHLRETGIQDVRQATQAAERVIVWNGAPRLVVSDAEFKFQLTLAHIDRFSANGDGGLQRGEFTADTLNCDPLDWEAIESRVFLVELAAQLRHGVITQQQYDHIISGGLQEAPAPQPLDPSAGAGAHGAAPGAGPAVLAVYAGGDADQSAAGHGEADRS